MLAVYSGRCEVFYCLEKVIKCSFIRLLFRRGQGALYFNCSGGGKAMPGVERDFQLFLEGLRVPENFVQTADERREALRGFLKKEIKVNLVCPGGSYRRGTGLFPVDSIKLHIVLSPKYYYECQKNSRKVLNFLRNVLAAKHSNARIGRDGQAVTVPFPERPAIDLLPSLKLSSGNFIVPNGIGGWFKVNPGRQENIFNKKEEESSGKFKNLVRIIKAWNKNIGRPFNSYFLDLLAYYRANDFSVGYGQLANSLFRSMMLFLPEFLSCPAVKAPISLGDMSNINRLIESASDLSGSALSETNHQRAIALWRSLLGDGF